MRLIKPQQRSVSWLLLLAGIMISMLISPVYSQSRTHDLGDFKYLVDADDAISTSGDDAGNAWPQDHYRYWMIHFYNTMFMVGSWTDETGGAHSKETIVDPISFNNGEGYGVFEYRKHEPPEVWVTAQGKLQTVIKTI